MYDVAFVERPRAEPGRPGRDERIGASPPAREASLTRQTIAWMAALPAHVRPTELAVRFPHAANSLAAAWPVREKCNAVFDALVRDRRDGRQGFPPRVALEVTALERYYDSLPHWILKSCWSNVGGR